MLVEGRSTPERIFETVERTQPTLFFSVPALYAAMVRAPGGRGHRFLERARVRVGGRAAARGRVQRAGGTITGVPILDGIGSTEMLHIYCSNTLGRPGARDDRAARFPGYELRIVDEQGSTSRRASRAT